MNRGAMKSNLYVETTVVSELAARPSRDTIVAAHQRITRDWWRLRRKRVVLDCSQLVVREAGAGDRTAADRRLALLRPVSLLAAPSAVAADREGDGSRARTGRRLQVRAVRHGRGRIDPLLQGPRLLALEWARWSRNGSPWHRRDPAC